MKVKYATMIVRDMEESVRFYTEVMGFQMDSEYRPLPGSVITLLKGEGEGMLELIQNPGYDIGLYSVGMDVEDLDSTLEELRARGANIVMEPVRTLVGSMAFVEDPNGVRMALIQHEK